MNIDVSEMMIGDWIQYYDYNGLHYRQFTADDFNLTEAEIAQYDYASVLLNATILLKNGFEEVGYNYYLFEEDTGKVYKKRRVTIDFDDNITITLSSPMIERIVWTTQYTPCVHELQHLMRAMNFEKEIEL